MGTGKTIYGISTYGEVISSLILNQFWMVKNI
ncbi:hypothetical protein IMSAGC022_00363 [Alistipes sp.]|nr:hypothetical protein IMSAGC022_00363 [Alistipes sp.]